jgi:hypothetical protein
MERETSRYFEACFFLSQILLQPLPIVKPWQTPIKQGVSHTMALPFTIKKYLKAKEELWKLKYITMQKYNLQIIL